MMELQERTNGKCLMAAVRDDMAVVEVTEEMQKIGSHLDGKSAVPNPGGRSRKK